MAEAGTPDDRYVAGTLEQVRGGSLPACAAPSIQLRFTPVGLVFPCCRTLRPLGHIAHDRLPDIWAGVQREELRRRLRVGDYSMGCQPCELEIRAEGWSAAYPAIHDHWASAGPEDPIWPTRFDFNLSNACNLQCVQCDGDSSSSIRIHREHRAPLPAVYGDQFFSDLEPFLPHLRWATFAGGEPFLGEENFRVWDLIAELAPDLPCTVVTNATQWGDRVEKVLDQLSFDVIVSLDGLTPATYESIRVGANHEKVMANVERLRCYTLERGTDMSINHCLMPSNYQEFGGLLLWAEERGLRVDVSVVRQPAHAAIGELPVPEIRRIAEALEAQQESVLPSLRLNRDTWLTEVARIRSWVADTETAVDLDRSNRMVLWFPCAGAGPVHQVAALDELRSFAIDGLVHEVVVGVDDTVRSCSPGLLDDPYELVGSGYHMLAGVLAARFGPMDDYRVIDSSDDRMDIAAVWGETECRIIGLPLRDRHGRASEATILLAFRPLVRS